MRKLKKDSNMYTTWRGMKQRCHSLSHPAYKDYGGRGVTVCQEWRDNFNLFERDMGPRPEGYSIDRINNNLGYFKANCRWASPKQQSSNKRTTKFATINGITKLVKEWAKESGIKYHTLLHRLSNTGDADSVLDPVKDPSIKVICLNTGEVFDSINQASIKFGLDPRSVLRSAVKGWSTKGYRFRYA